VLGPRYKLHWFEVAWKKEYADQAKAKITQLWTSKYKHGSQQQNTLHGADDTSVSSGTPGEGGIQALMAQKMRRFHKQDDELKRYLKEPIPNPGQITAGVDGALNFWKVRHSIVKIL